MSKQEKDVLKQKRHSETGKDVLKQEICHFVQKVCKTVLLQLFLIFFSIKLRMFSLHTAIVIQILLYFKVSRVQYILECSINRLVKNRKGCSKTGKKVRKQDRMFKNSKMDVKTIDL